MIRASLTSGYTDKKIELIIMALGMALEIFDNKLNYTKTYDTREKIVEDKFKCLNM